MNKICFAVAISRPVFAILAACALVWTANGYAIPNIIKPDHGGVGEVLQQRLQMPSPRVAQTKLKAVSDLRDFYARRDYRAAWLNAENRHLLSANISDLLHVISNAELEGLDAALYHRSEISAALKELSTALSLKANQLARLELLLSDAFLTYASHLTQGRFDAKTFHPTWTLPPRSVDLVAVLENALTNGNIHQTLTGLQPKHKNYAQLKKALAHYRKLQNSGGWPLVEAGNKLEKGVVHARVKTLRARLRASGDLAALPVAVGTDVDPETVFDEVLHQAVLRFQKRHGLLEDGIVGPQTLAALNVSVSGRIEQIVLNLERLRWLPDNLGDRHILVNIPGFEMHLVENNRPVFHSKVIVGQKKRPTPIFSDTMSHLVLSPYWNVPRSIAIKDKLPILRRSPYKLKRQKIRVFNSAGREIDPGSIDWHSVSARSFNYRMRQDPGPKNALGKVKFMFPNQHSVYLHDTSSPELFARNKRAFSSGCVRVAKPLELAVHLLKNNPQWDQKTLTSAMRQRRQRTVHLQNEVPVHLMYWTAWLDDDGTVQFRDDIYRRDGRLQQALNGDVNNVASR